MPVSDPESAKREQEAGPREQILRAEFNEQSELEPLVVEAGSESVERNIDLQAE